MTAAQRRVVERLAAGDDAFWDHNRAYHALLAAGFIERCDTTERVGKSGMRMTVYRCRLTPAGRAALATRTP